MLNSLSQFELLVVARCLECCRSRDELSRACAAIDDVRAAAIEAFFSGFSSYDEAAHAVRARVDELGGIDRLEAIHRAFEVNAFLADDTGGAAREDAPVPDLKSKLYGCVAGCAVGDALGASVEGTPRECVAERFGIVGGMIDLRDVPYYEERPDLLLRFWRMPGAHTDDTQQFLALVETYLRHGRLSSDLVAGAFADLFPHARGMGRGYRNFCKSLRRGAPWREARAEDNAGAGSAMRAGAIGLLFHDNLSDVIDHAVVQSCVTHADIRAHLAAVLVASTTGRAIHGQASMLGTLPAVREFHAQTALRMQMAVPVVSAVCERERVPVLRPRERSIQFLDVLGTIQTFLKAANSLDAARSRVLELFANIVDAAADDRSHGYAPTGTLNFALEAPVGAYIMFLLFGGDFREAVVRAIHLGGDTDTVAAMVGQMSGALVGFDPAWWTYKHRLEGDRVTFDATPKHSDAQRSIPIQWFSSLVASFQLLYRVDRLLGAPPAPAPPGMPIDVVNTTELDFLAIEAGICDLERNERRKLKATLRARRQPPPEPPPPRSLPEILDDHRRTGK